MQKVGTEDWGVGLLFEDEAQQDEYYEKREKIIMHKVMTSQLIIGFPQKVLN